MWVHGFHKLQWGCRNFRKPLIYIWWLLVDSTSDHVCQYADLRPGWPVDRMWVLILCIAPSWPNTSLIPWQAVSVLILCRTWLNLSLIPWQKVSLLVLCRAWALLTELVSDTLTVGECVDSLSSLSLADQTCPWSLNSGWVCWSPVELEPR
jgi:hypothetical protein